MDNRPRWTFNTPLGIARWLSENSVTEIKHHRKMTSADTSKEWISFHNRHNGKKLDNIPIMFDAGDRSVWMPNSVVRGLWKEIRFSPYRSGLIEMDDRLQGRLREMDKWDTQNAKERAEYERLKAKFEPTARD